VTTKATQEAAELLKQVLKETESAKGSVASAVRMLLRAAKILSDHDTQIWCEIQLGDQRYTGPLQDMLEKWTASEEAPQDAELKKKFTEALDAVARAGVKLREHVTAEELNVKLVKSGGGFVNIGFVEERYADLVRLKKGNDGTYYKNSLNNHLNHTRKVAHAHATRLYNRLAYADTPRTAFDVLKVAVDERLLDVAPEQAEQLMVAFRSVAGEEREAWSQALATCRRVLEGLADRFMPPRDELAAGRVVGEKQYINRLWVFMDEAIASDSNRELAKRHVDFVGSYLERVYRLTNKGVHAEVTRLEAVKVVFHTYLVAADLLEYTKPVVAAAAKLNVYTASLDELESVLDLSRETAKQIVRMRVDSPEVTFEALCSLKGIGKKKAAMLQKRLSFEKPGA
jgi:DNA uptake protein ComE-like DNA-binding protein